MRLFTVLESAIEGGKMITYLLFSLLGCGSDTPIEQSDVSNVSKSVESDKLLKIKFSEVFTQSQQQSLDEGSIDNRAMVVEIISLPNGKEI